MILRELSLSQFRNIPAATLFPDEQLTVITGENGQGKTNLIESIFLLTGSKSFRASRDIDLVRRGEVQGKVKGLTQAGNKQSEIEITIHGAGALKRGRFAKINGVEHGRASSIAGVFTAVVFAPGHLELVKSGPEARRRFLDAALCQLYPGYVGLLRRFVRALAQKNALLKKAQSTKDAETLLDIFDRELSESGAEISRRRKAYLDIAGPAAEEFYAQLSQKAETMELAFKPCCREGELAALLQKSRKADLRAGFSTSGPQREDFDVQLAGQSARVFGSQGQQRSVALSLKLAEAKMVKEVSGEHPVMLLDDVLSELDEKRQRFLLSGMQGKQNFLSSCDGAFPHKTGGKVIRMHRGEILE